MTQVQRHIMLISILSFQDVQSAPLIRRYIPPRKASAVSKPPKIDPATQYMHHPPTIMPNYGKRKELGIPKTSLSRVLLYDNITQQHILDVKLANIKIEKQRIERQMNLNQHSFRSRMSQKQKQQQAGRKNRSRFLPQIGQSENCNSSSGRLLNEPSFRLEDIRLPRKHQNGKEILFRVKTKHGRVSMFHSYDENEIFSKLFPLHTFYPTVKDDPRFNTLKDSLVRLETCLNFAGFVELSPSFNKYIPKIPSILNRIEEARAEDANEEKN